MTEPFVNESVHGHGKAFCGKHPYAGWIEPDTKCKRCKWLEDNGFAPSTILATCGHFTGLRQWGLHPEVWRICQVCWTPKAQHEYGRVTPEFPGNQQNALMAQAHIQMTEALNELLGEFAWSATVPTARIKLILETYRNG